MLPPEISVILPVRNSETTILRAVDSILSQTFKAFELIIINDGSTDSTFLLLQQYKDTRIQLINQKNLGIAKALNLGIQNAKGKLIARMDADDYSFPERLQLQYDHLKQYPDIDLVSCLIKYKGNKEAGKGYYLYVKWLNQVRSPDDIFLKRFIESPLSHPSVMMRKSLFYKFGFYNESKLAEDYELWLRLLHKKVRIAKINKYLFEWSDSPNRVSRTHQNYSKEVFFNLKARYFAKWYHERFKNISPKILIWGTGKSVYHKSMYLTQYQIPVYGYIDILKKKVYRDKPVIYYEEIEKHKEKLILSYVSDREGKVKILKYLTQHGFVEGENFYLMA